MSELKNAFSEGNLPEANSDTDLFKSLSDVSIAHQQAGSSTGTGKEYIPSPLAKDIVKVISSTTVAPLNAEDDPNDEVPLTETDPLTRRCGHSRTRGKNYEASIEANELQSTSLIFDESNIITSTQNEAQITKVRDQDVHRENVALREHK